MPSLAVSVCPCWAVPLIVGAAVFAGGVAGDADARPPVWAEVALLLPALLLAVTTTRMRGADVGADEQCRSGAVAPLMLLQLVPAAVAAPPLVAVADRRGPAPACRRSRSASAPAAAVPLIVGAAVFAGAVVGVAACTVAVWAEVALLLPALLLAVTTTRMVVPTSALASR